MSNLLAMVPSVAGLDGLAASFAGLRNGLASPPPMLLGGGGHARARSTTGGSEDEDDLVLDDEGDGDDDDGEPIVSPTEPMVCPREPARNIRSTRYRRASLVSLMPRGGGRPGPRARAAAVTV